jgi:hypothetical protein
VDNDLGATVTAVKPVDLLDWVAWAGADISRWGARVVATLELADDKMVDDDMGIVAESDDGMVIVAESVAPAGAVWSKLNTGTTLEVRSAFVNVD